MKQKIYDRLKHLYPLGLLLVLTTFLSTNVLSQTVTGTITDERGNPLPGSAVVLKGTSVGTTADVDGEYSIKVSGDNDTLKFSYVGFSDQEVAVKGRTTINVKLSSSMELDEVVVTALGVEREEKALGYTLQKVDGESIKKARETNFVNSLNGKVAGVDIQGGSSSPAASSNVVIRGINSLTGNNQPLFVVDGMPITNGIFSPGDGLNGSSTVDFGNAASMINTYDIESVNVLKGPTAAALYGTRASNGVVLVTTKKGKGSEGLGIEVNSNFTVQTPLKLPDYQNEYGGGSGGKYSYQNGLNYGSPYDAFGESWGPKTDGKMVKQYVGPEGGEILPFEPHPDNIRDFYQTGTAVTNNVAITNSTETSDLRFSYTNLQQRGIVPNTPLSRNMISMSIGKEFSERLNIRANVHYLNGQSDNVPNSGYDESSSIMYGWLWYPRHQDITALQDYWITENEQQANFEQLWTNNPYFLVNENTNAYNRDRIYGNAHVKYDFTDNFNVRFRTGLDALRETRTFRRGFSTRQLPFGYYREDHVRYTENNNELLLTYQSDRGSSDFTYEVSLGGNMMYQEIDIQGTTAPQLSEAGIFNLTNARTNLQVLDNLQRKAINSVFGLGSFSYKSMLYLDVTARNDWSSTLPQDNNSFLYPSGTVSFIVSEAFDLPEVLSFVKVRAGAARVGGDTDPYNLRNVYNFQSSWGGQPVASESSTLANSELKPEFTSTLEAGVDLRFFQGRLNLDFTYYDISSTNQIINVAIPVTSGYDNRFVNAGEIQNRGFEAVLSGTPIESNDLQWDFTVNFSRNQGRIIELAEGIEVYQVVSDMYPADGGQDLSLEAREGELVGQLVGLGMQRVEEGEFAGQIIHEDGRPLNTTEKVSAGSYQPDFLLGIENRFTYKNLSFSFLFGGQIGGNVFSRTHTMLATGGAITNNGDDAIGSTLEGRSDYAPVYDNNGNFQEWETIEEGDGYIGEGVQRVTDNQGNVVGYEENETAVSTRRYFYDYYGNGFNRDVITTGTYDATYFKLREVVLSYSLPQNVLDGSLLEGITLSLVGRNLLLFSDVPSIDPETYSIRNGRFIPGYESTAIPSTRSIGLDLNIRL